MTKIASAARSNPAFIYDSEAEPNMKTVARPTRGNRERNRNRQGKNSRARRDYSNPESPVISAAEAIAMGWTPGQLRTIANSLDRISRIAYPPQIEYVCNLRGDVAVSNIRERVINHNPVVNQVNAQRFRFLANQVERLLNAEV